MTHLDEARLLTLRDGDAGIDPVSEAHVAECGPCQVVLERLRGRSATIAQALASLDADHDLESARAGVRQRVTGQAAVAPKVTPLRRRRSTLFGMELSRAAGIILVTATAAAAAIPGSPIRGWVQGLISSDAGPTNTVAAPESSPVGDVPETAGVRLAVGSGPLHVTLLGVSAGGEIRVHWVVGAEAAVFAPAGSRFTSGENRIDAAVVPGAVRVELPEGLVPVSLEVNGRIYLSRTSEGLEIVGPVAERRAEEVVFRVPGG